LVIGLIGYLQVVSTNNYNSIADLGLLHDATVVAPPQIFVALFLAARIFVLATKYATSHGSVSKWSWKRQAL
jgi:hypothetical protein